MVMNWCCPSQARAAVAAATGAVKTHSATALPHARRLKAPARQRDQSGAAPSSAPTDEFAGECSQKPREEGREKTINKTGCSSHKFGDSVGAEVKIRQWYFKLLPATNLKSEAETYFHEYAPFCSERCFW